MTPSECFEWSAIFLAFCGVIIVACAIVYGVMRVLIWGFDLLSDITDEDLR